MIGKTRNIFCEVGLAQKYLYIVDADASRSTVSQNSKYPDILAFSRLADRASQHPKLPTYFFANPESSAESLDVMPKAPFRVPRFVCRSHPVLY